MWPNLCVCCGERNPAIENVCLYGELNHRKDLMLVKVLNVTHALFSRAPNF